MQEYSSSKGRIPRSEAAKYTFNAMYVRPYFSQYDVDKFRVFLPLDCNRRLRDDVILAHLNGGLAPKIEPIQAEVPPIVRLFEQIFVNGPLGKNELEKKLSLPKQLSNSEFNYMQKLLHTLGIMSMDMIFGENIPKKNLREKLTFSSAPPPGPGPYKELLSSFGVGEFLRPRLFELLIYEKNRPGSIFARWEGLGIESGSQHDLSGVVDTVLASMQQYESLGYQAFGIYGALSKFYRQALKTKDGTMSTGDMTALEDYMRIMLQLIYDPVIPGTDEKNIVESRFAMPFRVRPSEIMIMAINGLYQQLLPEKDSQPVIPTPGKLPVDRMPVRFDELFLKSHKTPADWQDLFHLVSPPSETEISKLHTILRLAECIGLLTMVEVIDPQSEPKDVPVVLPGKGMLAIEKKPQKDDKGEKKFEDFMNGEFAANTINIFSYFMKLPQSMTDIIQKNGNTTVFINFFENMIYKLDNIEGKSVFDMCGAAQQLQKACACVGKEKMPNVLPAVRHLMISIVDDNLWFSRLFPSYFQAAKND